MHCLDALSEKSSEIAAICRRHKVRQLSLFGSGLGAQFSKDSDIDLLVEFASGASVGLIELAEMQQELEALLSRKVDLVPSRGLKPFLRQRILSQALPVYAG